MIKVTEHKFGGGISGIMAMEGKRPIVRARRAGAGGWIIRGFGLCLLDKRPHPAAPGVAGIVDPSRMWVRDIRTARKIVSGIAEGAL